MKDIFVVSKFTVLDMIKRKSFIVSSLIIMLFIIVGFNIPNIINSFKGETSDSLSKSYVVDSNNIFEDSLDSLNNMELGYEFIIENNEVSLESIEEKLENGDISEAIVIDRVDGNLEIKYIILDSTFYSGVPSDLQYIFNNLYHELQLSKLNISKEEYDSLHEEINYSLVSTNKEEVKGNPFIVMLISIVLFFAIYFYAFQVSSSITTEKTSKIIETLITSTSPKNIVLGKTIGIGLVGLMSIIIYILTAVVCKNLFMSNVSLDGIIDFSTFTPFLGIITIVYFILGYALYALLYALVGSTVSKPEDVQSANGPISIIAVLGFYLAYFTMLNPTSSLNKLAAVFPISSPFCMPFRVMMDIANPTDIILSVIALVITITLIAVVSVKIYSQAILNYGNKINLKDAIKLFKSKD